MSVTSSSIQVKIGNVLFRYRSYTLIPVALAIFIFSKPSFFLGNIGREHFLFFIGLMISLFGQGIRIFTQGYALGGTSSWSDKLEAGDLNTGGVYRWVRNPLYLGNFFILFGLLIIYNSFTGYLIGMISFALHSWFIVQAEENFLKDKFGQKYLDYCREVPRFLPRFRKTGMNQSFNWLRVIKKEQDSFTGLLAYGLVLEIYKIIVNNGFKNSKKEIFNLTICLLIVILMFSGLKFWKKTQDKKSLTSR